MEKALYRAIAKVDAEIRRLALAYNLSLYGDGWTTSNGAFIANYEIATAITGPFDGSNPVSTLIRKAEADRLAKLAWIREQQTM